MANTYKRTLVNLTGELQNITVPSINGAWNWYNNPRAVYSNGKSYITYVNSSGDVGIVQHNHSTRVTSSYVFDSAFEVDDHANPAVHILPSGKLFVVYAPHVGNITYTTSTGIEDISAWETLADIPNVSNASYPTIVQLSGESNLIYIFYRVGTGANRPIYYVTYDGEDWTAQVKTIDNAGQRPYTLYKNTSTKIHFAFHNGHPAEVALNNLYHCYYEGGNYYQTNGELIGAIVDLPVLPADATKIYDADSNSDRGSWAYDITLDSNGYPVIVYATMNTAVSTFPDHRYRYARWNGSEWLDNQIIYSGEAFSTRLQEDTYSGGICLDHANPNVIYFSKQEGAKYEIWKGITSNLGVDWSFQRMTSNSTYQNLRPTTIRDGVLEMPLVWMRGTYTNYNSYNTQLVTPKFK